MAAVEIEEIDSRNAGVPLASVGSSGASCETMLVGGAAVTAFDPGVVVGGGGGTSEEAGAAAGVVWPISEPAGVMDRAWSNDAIVPDELSEAGGLRAEPDERGPEMGPTLVFTGTVTGLSARAWSGMIGFSALVTGATTAATGWTTGATPVATGSSTGATAVATGCTTGASTRVTRWVTGVRTVAT